MVVGQENQVWYEKFKLSLAVFDFSSRCTYSRWATRSFHKGRYTRACLCACICLFYIRPICSIMAVGYASCLCQSTRKASSNLPTISNPSLGLRTKDPRLDRRESHFCHGSCGHELHVMLSQPSLLQRSILQKTQKYITIYKYDTVSICSWSNCL